MLMLLVMLLLLIMLMLRWIVRSDITVLVDWAQKKHPKRFTYSFDCSSNVCVSFDSCSNAMPYLTVLVMLMLRLISRSDITVLVDWAKITTTSDSFTRLVVLVMLTFHLVVLVMLNASFNCRSNA